MPRNISLYILAALIGGLIAFAYVKPVGAQECRNAAHYMKSAERSSKKHGGKPYWIMFKRGPKGVVTGWILFFLEAKGVYLVWSKESDCAPTFAKLIPAQSILPLIPKDELNDLMKDGVEWQQSKRTDA
jgi:hypothetical protein